MKTKIFFSFILPMLAIVLVGCSEDKVRSPHKAGEVPGDITVKEIKNIPGGAVIKYLLPGDVDILYVKGEFVQCEEITREVRSSCYVDSLVIYGLGDVTPKDVKLTAVTRSEVSSPGITVTINPTTPPVVSVRESLTAVRDWGGFTLNYVNRDNGKDLAIEIYIKNENTQGVEFFDYAYPNKLFGVLQMRGLEGISTEFSLIVTDRWGNRSEPYNFELTPRPESQVDGTRFLVLKSVAKDTPYDIYNGSVEKLFDMSLALDSYCHTPFNDAKYPFPHAFTVDMKVSVLLSRIKFWQRQNEEEFYAHGTPKHFQIWGCEDGKDPSNLDNYELLMEQNWVKPSGGGKFTPNTPEDIQAARDGHEFLFEDPDNKPAVRYFRFISMESWSTMITTRMAEMRIWGHVQKTI